MTIREIKILVTARRTGRFAGMFSYPVRDGKTYKVPTYYVIVSGTDDTGKLVKGKFDATRFGPMKFAKNSRTQSRGWHWSHWKTIILWDPHYKAGNERGAWVIDPKAGLKHTLVHDGWHQGATFVTATQGCVGICGAPLGFKKFNDYLISLSGLSKSSAYKTREKKLRALGSSKKMALKFEYTTPPRLVVL